MIERMTLRLGSIFNVEHLNYSSKHLLLRYITYASIVRGFLSLSSTFLVLYVLDAVGFAVAGILIAIQLLVQAVFDYPTGILSDWLGQQTVLLLSYSSFGIAFLLFSYSSSYYFLLVAYVFYAFATAQESGTLISWFDNNYKFISTEDPERIAYRSIIGKARTIIDVFGGIMLIVGGLLATNHSRILVFRIQVILTIFVLYATFLLIYDFDGYSRDFDTGTKYFNLLKDGITSIFQSRLLTLIVFAGVFFQVCMGSFGSLLLFPIYFGYTGSDLGASVFRFSLFISGSLALWMIADYIGRLSTKKWFTRIHFIHSILFFVGFIILFMFFPISDNFNLSGIIIAGTVIFVTHMLRVAVNIHLQRIFLDLIPDERRNGFYSFQPTLVLLFQAPVVYFSGSIIETGGFVNIIYFLGLLGFISSILYFFAIRKLPVEL